MTPIDKKFLTIRPPESPGKAGRRAALPSLRDVVTTVFRHKWKILLIFSAIAASGTTYILQMPDLYRSEAKLLIRSAAPAIQSDSSINQSGSAWTGSIANELAILKSRELSDKVAADFEPERLLEASTEHGVMSWMGKDRDAQRFPEAAAVELARHAVSTSSDGDVITVTTTLGDPHIARDFLSALLDRYLERHLELYATSPEPDSIKAKSEDLLAELQTQEATLREYRDRYEISSVEQQGRAYFERVHELESALGDLHVQQSSTDARIKTLQEVAEEESVPGPVKSVELENPEITKLRERILELRIQEIELNSRFIDNRDLRSVRKQIADLKAAITELPPTITYTPPAVETAPDDGPRVILQAEKVIRIALDASELSLTQELEKARQRLAMFEQHADVVAEMERELEYLRTAYRVYRDSLGQAEISLALRGLQEEKIAIIQPATLPEGPIAPLRAGAIPMVLFLAISAGLAAAFISEHLDDTVKSEDDLARKCNIPILATVSAKEFKQCI